MRVRDPRLHEISQEEVEGVALWQCGPEPGARSQGRDRASTWDTGYKDSTSWKVDVILLLGYPPPQLSLPECAGSWLVLWTAVFMAHPFLPN